VVALWMNVGKGAIPEDMVATPLFLNVLYG